MSCALDCFSDYLRAAINKHVHGGPDYTRPATTYFALMSVLPGSNNVGGTEIALARVALTNDSTSWAETGTNLSNIVPLSWGSYSGSPVAMVGICEFDASTSGNLLTYGAFSWAVILNTGISYTLNAGAVTYGWG